jgi:hypothetical protein
MELAATSCLVIREFANILWNMEVICSVHKCLRMESKMADVQNETTLRVMVASRPEVSF